MPPQTTNTGLQSPSLASHSGSSDSSALSLAEIDALLQLAKRTTFGLAQSPSERTGSTSSNQRQRFHNIQQQAQRALQTQQMLNQQAAARARPQNPNSRQTPPGSGPRPPPKKPPSPVPPPETFISELDQSEDEDFLDDNYVAGDEDNEDAEYAEIPLQKDQHEYLGGALEDEEVDAKTRDVLDIPVEDAQPAVVSAEELLKALRFSTEGAVGTGELSSAPLRNVEENSQPLSSHGPLPAAITRDPRGVRTHSSYVSPTGSGKPAQSALANLGRATSLARNPEERRHDTLSVQAFDEQADVFAQGIRAQRSVLGALKQRAVDDPDFASLPPYLMPEPTDRREDTCNRLKFLQYARLQQAPSAVAQANNPTSGRPGAQFAIPRCPLRVQPSEMVQRHRAASLKILFGCSEEDRSDAATQVKSQLDRLSDLSHDGLQAVDLVPVPSGVLSPVVIRSKGAPYASVTLLPSPALARMPQESVEMFARYRLVALDRGQAFPRQDPYTFITALDEHALSLPRTSQDTFTRYKDACGLQNVVDPAKHPYRAAYKRAAGQRVPSMLPLLFDMWTPFATTPISCITELHPLTTQRHEAPASYSSKCTRLAREVQQLSLQCEFRRLGSALQRRVLDLALLLGHPATYVAFNTALGLPDELLLAVVLRPDHPPPKRTLRMPLTTKGFAAIFVTLSSILLHRATAVPRICVDIRHRKASTDVDHEDQEQEQEQVGGYKFMRVLEALAVESDHRPKSLIERLSMRRVRKVRTPDAPAGAAASRLRNADGAGNADASRKVWYRGRLVDAASLLADHP